MIIESHILYVHFNAIKHNYITDYFFLPVFSEKCYIYEL